MNFAAISSLVLLLVTCACSTPAPERAATAVPPQGEVAPPAPSAASDRAEALLADIAKREAEYKKAEAAVAARDRATPLPVTQSVLAPAASASSSAPTTTAAQPTPTAAPANDRDESWWKNEMRTAEVRATEDVRRLQEAIDTQDRARSQMSAAVGAGAVVFAQAQEAYNRATAEVQRLQAEVRNNNAAVERVREDARRAGIPPGWLRWP